MSWLEQPAGAVTVTARGRLNVGRNRMNCTLPIGEQGVRLVQPQLDRRESDGGWYRESKIQMRISLATASAS